MTLLGCCPAGRLTEQHDVFFGIGPDIRSLIPQIKAAWKNSGTIHLDAWREVNVVNGFRVEIVPRENQKPPNENKLFFINLGGYKPGEFDEFHYKMLVVAKDKQSASALAKQSAFFKHTGFATAPAHIDDHYGVDVDDLHDVKDILPAIFKEQFAIQLTPGAEGNADDVKLGYMPLDKL